MIDVTRCVQGIGNGSVKIDMASCELRIDRFGELPIVVDLRGALHHVGGGSSCRERASMVRGRS